MNLYNEKEVRFIPFLEDGKIPAWTPCKWKDQCFIKRHGTCNHRGSDHEKNFSCATARAFELMDKNSFKPRT